MWPFSVLLFSENESRIPSRRQQVEAGTAGKKITMNAASPWFISYSIGASKHYADVRLVSDGATVFSRLLTGDSRDEAEKKVAKFLESDDATKALKEHKLK